MAPVPEAYFASLDKCFSGDAQLLSWKRVFLALCEPATQITEVGSVATFLSQPESLQLLSTCLTSFDPPSAKTKSEFESKTAAIHVDASPQASYKIDEIKSDALWLSQKAGIDEVSALRIAVLEWQSRPNARLIGRFSEEEATSLQDATSVDNFRLSLAGPQLKEVLRRVSGGSDAGFSSQTSRRKRLQGIYLAERSHILKTSRKLLGLSLRDTIPSGARLLPRPNAPNEPVENDGLASLGKQLFGVKKGEADNRFLLDAIKGIQKRLADFQTEGGWLSISESDEETDSLWRTTLVDEAVHIMQIILLKVQSLDAIPSGDVVLAWLQLMVEYKFMEPVTPPCENPLVLRLSLQVLASVTTLALLKLPDSLALVEKNSKLPQAEALSQSKPYFLSRQHITEINEIFLNAVDMGILSASPPAFAWGAVLFSMREYGLEAKETREMEQFHSAVDSFQSNTPAASSPRASEQTFYEELLDVVRVPAYGDRFIDLLTLGSIEKGQLFDVVINIASTVDTLSAIDDAVTGLWIRSSLLGVVRVSSQLLDYSPEIMAATLSILNGSANSFQGHKDSLAHINDPRHAFLQDEKLMDRIFHISRSRFPYESVPFLRLCRALIGKDAVDADGASFVLNQLETMETFTQEVSSDFQGYETIREDENANFVSLVQPIPMLKSPPTKLKRNAHAETALVVTGTSHLQPMTTGQVVSESKPAVIMWYHNYSCLSFLGIWLEKWAVNGGDLPGTDEEIIVEIIGLLTDLIAAFHKADSKEDGSGPRKILEIASEGLSDRSDIVSVVYDILERNLQDGGTSSGVRGSLELVVACLRFAQVLVPILPNRTWPFLSRTSLLDSSGQGGRWSVIVSAAEVTSGDYPFLLSFVDLFDAVIEDAITNAAIRRIASREVTRAGDVSEKSAGVPSHIMSKALSSFVRAMIGVYNSTGNWRFNQPECRLQIETVLARNFERIIYYTHGIDDTENSQSKISGIFHESAAYILDVLRPLSNDEIPFNPILRIIIDGLQTPTTTIYLRQILSTEQQVIATLNLAVKLTQAAHLLHSPASLLENQLFKASSVLVKLYSSHYRYRLPIVILLELLVSRTAADSESEPPSLVGHLGSESTCLFLDVLAQFDKPLTNRALFVSIWRLLSAFVSKRQQWLAIYLLTGSSPRDSLKPSSGGEKAPRMRSTPFLKTALDSLANIGQIDASISLALLEFVSYSQEHWPWATTQLGSHSSFFGSIVNYVSHLKLESQSVTNQIHLTQIAAITANLCAIYLHSAKEARDQTFIKTLIPLVFWYADNAVDISSYNASLHANLKKNFEMRYKGCRLQQFKRTSLESRPLGRDYYYDLVLSDKLLSFDFSWRGKKGQGFADEFERANLNLSLVEAQVNLFNSWKFFAIEHSTDFTPDKNIQKSMALVVRNCLLANTRPVPEEPIFAKLQQSRVDFAVSMLQKLVEVGADGPELVELLSVVWDTMRARGTTYENALIHNDTEYYRSLLNVLFLALQFHVARSPPSEPAKKKPDLSPDLSIVLEVIKVVIAQGFRSLTTYLHDEPQRCSPKDFAIITAILQTALRVKDAERLYEQIVFHIEDNDTARYATTLFSWADQLTVEGDPVYGELSVIFLVDLSAIPMLAEYLAVEAVLMKLSTSRLTRIMSQGKGFGPFDPVPRLYAIWTDGILPLCLNLLFHVTRSAPEVAAFLNQFDRRLSLAAESFSNVHVTSASTQSGKKICLSMASEAYSLALISFILEQYRAAGPSAGVDSQAVQELKWDKGQLKEDIEELLSRPASLRARIVATSDKEVELARQKPLDAAVAAENRLEERIMKHLTAALTCLSGGEDS